MEVAHRNDDQFVEVVGDPVGLVIVIEFDLGRFADNQWDVRPALDGIDAIVLAPAAVERGFVARSLFVAIVGGLDLVRALPDIVFDVVGQQCVFTRRLPFAGTAQFILVRAGDVDDVRLGSLRLDG